MMGGLRDEWMIRRAGSQGRQAGSPEGRVGKLLSWGPKVPLRTGDPVTMGRGLPHCGFGREGGSTRVVGHVSSCLVLLV